MLEALVRPFQEPQTATRRIVSVRTKVEVETAGLDWGEAGEMPEVVHVAPGEDPLLVNFNTRAQSVTREHEVTAMKTEKVKVVNPEDDSQYIITERVRRVRFAAKHADQFWSEGDPDQQTNYINTPGDLDRNPNPISDPQPALTSMADKKGQIHWKKVERNDYSIHWTEKEMEGNG